MSTRVLTAASLMGFVVAAQAGPDAISGSESVNQLSRAEKAAGWKLLFDGTSNANWRGYKQKAFPEKGWVIEDGCLKVVGGEAGGDIVTNDQYGDFELQIEWKVSPKANSGIVYRATEAHDTVWQTGLEYQVLDDAGTGTAPTEAHSAGAIYDLYPPPSTKVVKLTGEFNHTRIRVQGHHIQHWLNGVKTVDCDSKSDDYGKRIAASKFKDYSGFGIQPKGHIALQEHGDTVWFRNIKIRDLNVPMPQEVSLFDGKSMAGWTHHLEKPDAKMDETWSVVDGIIICKGEPAGYIRTEKDYKNFVLKLQWRFNPVTKKAGNSGVLVRMQAPDKVWPKSIEAQLHSENAGDFWIIDDYPMKADPARMRGRNVKKLAMAENPVGEWNEYEIIVDGGNITLFVNGQFVNQGTEAAELPGKICLQSEGAEIQFRHIRLAPIE